MYQQSANRHVHHEVLHSWDVTGNYEGFQCIYTSRKSNRIVHVLSNLGRAEGLNYIGI